MTSKDKKGFGEWLSAHASGQEDERALKKVWEMTGSYQDGYQPDVEKGWSALKGRMGTGKAARLRPAARLLRLAAVALVLLVAGFVLKNYLYAPSAETIVSEAATRPVPLADGSTVTLNHHSRLTFPKTFDGATRTVQLQGEAFFEVAPDASKPFVVETAKATVTVLGTSFNVRSLPGEPSLLIFVKTGQVEVKISATGKTYRLSPGHLLSIPADEKTVEITDAPGDNPIGWKQGQLKFRETPLNEILADVERQFGVGFDLGQVGQPTCPFTITFEKGKLREALDAIEASCPLHFGKAVNGTISVTGECCK